MYQEVWKAAVLAVGLDGEAIVNTFHFAYDGTDPVTSGLTVADQVDNVIVPLIAALVTVDWVYVKSQVICVKGTQLGVTGESELTAGASGTVAGVSAPMSLALICKRSGSVAGRHNRGRVFLSPIPAAMMDTGSKITPGPATAANCLALAIGSLNILGNVYDQILWSPGAPNGVLLTQGSPAKIAGVQKRRRLRLPN